MLQLEKSFLIFEMELKMKRSIILLTLAFSLLLAACSWNAAPDGTETPAVTPTADLCSLENLPREAARVNKLMREFDDYSALASNTPQNQLVVVIPEMQRILRDAEDLVVPACTQTLKDLQTAHMDMVVQTLIFLYGHPISPTSPDAAVVNVINAGITQARELHAKYDIELAHLLGITPVPQPTSPPVIPITPEATPIAQAAAVTNPGPNGVNLRSSPSLDAPESGILDALASTTALGRSADDQWIQVEIPGQPGQTAWVFASLVQLSVPITQLPVVNQ